MRKSFSSAAVLAVAALSLGACNNPNDDAAVNDTYADTAATMPADNTMADTNVMTNTTVNPDGSITTTNPDGTTVTTNTTTDGVSTNTTVTTNTTY